jgi:putative transcriptional regulator
MTKRNLFAELTEGFDALASARKGKKTLHTTEVERKPAVEISADELRAIREKLNLSRPVFASYLRTIHARLRTGSKAELSPTRKPPF